MITPTICQYNYCKLFAIFVVFVSMIYAMIEIELEGKHGWAKTLHTVHITKDRKSLTYYHLLMFIFIFSMFYVIFALKQKYMTIKNSLYIFTIVLSFFMLEDMYWFILNPHHSFFNRNNSDWHVSVGKVPILYIVIPIVTILINFCIGYGKTFAWNILIFIIGTLIVGVLSYPYGKVYKAIHKKTNFDIYIEEKEKK